MIKEYRQQIERCQYISNSSDFDDVINDSVPPENDYVGPIVKKKVPLYDTIDAKNQLANEK